MQDVLLRKRPGCTRPSPRERLSKGCTAGGAIASVITVVISASDLVTAQQAIAMALASALATMGGLVVTIIPDAWTAWRRGFRQGCEAGLEAQARDIGSDVTATTRREQGQRYR